jgi:hypothetical protein
VLLAKHSKKGNFDMSFLNILAIYSGSAEDFVLLKAQFAFSSKLALDEILNHDRNSKHPSG